MLRRQSTIGGRRRSTIITLDEESAENENFTEEEIMENYRQILSTVKTQTWPMYRKIKALRKAKLYIKRHEGEMKQSKQAKDIVATFKTAVRKSIKKLRREITNLIVQLTPWEMRIKKIESQFGSVVASYFTFLRWVFWINTFISIFICVFLMVPEILRGVQDPTGMRKEVESQESALTLQAIWDFEGYLKYSPIFYGYYSSEETTNIGYRLPLAYFLTSVILYLFSFFCILRKMTQTARMSRAGSKDDEYVFTWKVFTGWDYLIGNSETAYNKVASIVMGFKEVILEEKERKKEEKKDWKMITLRILANFFVLFLLGTSAYAVVLVVERSQDMPENPGWVRENEVTLVVAGIGIVYPNIFNIIGMVEAYHPGIQLKWQLARILVLNLLNLYTLMFSLFGKVDIMTAALTEYRNNITVEKRLRMTWETEMTVSVLPPGAVLLDTLNRVERALQDGSRGGGGGNGGSGGYHDDEIEGRFFWQRGDGSDRLDGQSSGREEEGTVAASGPSTDWMQSVSTTKLHPLFPSSTSSGPDSSPSSSSMREREDGDGEEGGGGLNQHGSLVIKDEWTRNQNEEEDPNVEIIEGRRAVPAFISPPKKSSSSPDPGGGRGSDSSDSLNETSSSTFPFSSPSWNTQSTFPTGSPSSSYGWETTTSPSSSLPASSATITGTGRMTRRPRQTTTTTSSQTILLDDSSGSSMPTVMEYSTTTEYEADVTTYTAEGDISLPKRCPGDEPELLVDDEDLLLLDEADKEILRTLCWETMFGQELTKLTVMDFVLTAVSTVIGDFLRAVIVRYCNGKACFFWDLEKGFPGYSDFPIAENILHLVNNQGMVWLGMFFSPGLPAINTIKLCLMMYLRSWAVLTCNIPHETVFKASGNNFYYALLLLMLFICCLPVAYTCVWLAPSWHCGPFSEYERVYHILTKYIESKLPDTLNKVVDYLTSPGSIIPLLLLLILIIYYLMSSVSNLKEMNSELKSQIRKEKDLTNPEMAKSSIQAGLHGSGSTLAQFVPPEKKHVGFSEEIATTSDEVHLLEKRRDSP